MFITYFISYCSKHCDSRSTGLSFMEKQSCSVAETSYEHDEAEFKKCLCRICTNKTGWFDHIMHIQPSAVLCMKTAYTHLELNAASLLILKYLVGNK